MRSANFLVLVAFSLMAVSCSSDDREEIGNRSPSAQEATVEFPKATGEWIEARIFMIESDDQVQDCAQVDFRVMAQNGVFSVNECEVTKTGQLTTSEFVELDGAATAAYQKTEGAVCAEIFRFDKFYVSIDAMNDEFDRNFDPDTSCYRGSEAAVSTYKSKLRQLLGKYSSGSVTE